MTYPDWVEAAIKRCHERAEAERAKFCEHIKAFLELPLEFTTSYSEEDTLTCLKCKIDIDWQSYSYHVSEKARLEKIKQELV